MSGAVFQHGPKRPGWVYLGTGPKTGHPRDAQGRLILVHEYVPPVRKTFTDCADRSPEAPAVTNLSPPKVSRGVASTAQGDLL